MSLHQPIAANDTAETPVDVIAAAFRKFDANDRQACIAMLAKELSAREQVALIRTCADELSFSYGADRIEQGCSFVESDLDDEEAAVATGIPHLPQYERRAVALNPEAWS